MQGYIALEPGQTQLKFIAMDLGPGIPGTLKDRYRFENDAEAICLACEAGVTSKDRGGLGLYQTTRILEAAEGFMHIVSGQASVLFWPEGRYCVHRSDPLTLRGYVWGTQVGILLPCKKGG